MPDVTLVVGDEELLVARAIQRVVTDVRARVGDEVPIHDVEAGATTVDDFAELTSPSLFGDARVVVLRAVQDAAKELAAAMAQHAADGSDEIRLVAVHAGGAKGKAVVEALKGAGAKVVDAPRVKSARDREQFVADEVRGAG